MTRSLPENPRIDLLKKQAKKLLKNFRNADPDALASVYSNHPKPGAFTGLRDAQLVIARSYGYAGWTELVEAVELAQDTTKTLSDKATLFIQLGCLRYHGGDTLRNYQRARRLLATNPDIAKFSFYAALVANNASKVFEYLASDSTLATTSGGPLGWPPLLYVTYSRIGEPDNTQQSLSIVKRLLECGASANSHIILNDAYRFTALTGAMGEGEQGVNQPPHQYAEDMAELLLGAGAHPNEGQGLYNTMFTDSGDKWLAILVDYGLNADDPLNWDATDDKSMVTTLNYQLSCAVDSNRHSRVSLILNAGANVNACNTYNGRAIHTNALLAGHTRIAQLLEKKGATVEQLDFNDQFRLACVRESYDAMAALVDSYPELIEDSSLLHAAAEHANTAVIERMIELGFDVNAQSEHGRTLLHHYALSNDTAAIQKLLTLGARADIRDRSYNSIAAGFAAHSASYAAMRMLLDVSGSLLDVVSCAYAERAKTLVENNPASLHDQTDRGNTVLHIVGSWLHDEPDYDVYDSLVEWLITAGADVNAKNKQNQSPVQFAVANGNEMLADIISEYG